MALASSRAGARSVALAALLATLFGVSVWMPQWSPEETEDAPNTAFAIGPSIELPLDMDGWKMGVAYPLDHDFFWTLKFPQYMNRPYRLEGVKVDVFLGYGDRRNRNWSLLSPKNALPERGWEVEDRSFTRLDSWDRQVERVVARSGQRRVVTYHWYDGLDSVAMEALRALFATDQSPFRRSERPRVIRIGTQVGVGALEETEADRKLLAFAEVLAGVLRARESKPLLARGGASSGGARQGATESEPPFPF